MSNPQRRQADKSYPKTAIDGLIKGVYDKIDEKAEEHTLHFKELNQAQERRHEENKARFLEIKEQTTETNGHVAEAFKEIRKLDNWKNFIMGGLTILAIIVVPLLFIFITRGL